MRNFVLKVARLPVVGNMLERVRGEERIGTMEAKTGEQRESPRNDTY